MFRLKAPFQPSGDQPKAIKALVEGLKKGYRMQTLLGVTGSGKSFSISNVIAAYGRPTLVMAHNKTLAFQLYNELKSFFPDNKVEFFISYYDYYQPESYLPASDTYIEKDASINPKIEQMRLSATTSLLSRKDTIIVASVSAIYSIGDPEPYKNATFTIRKGQQLNRRQFLQTLIKMQYERNDMALEPGRFRVKGPIIDIIPTYQDNVIRVQLDSDKVGSIIELQMPQVEIKEELQGYIFFPAKHFVIEQNKIDKAIEEIQHELEQWAPTLEQENQLFAYRLKQKVKYDIEMIKEMGYCNGIENYSRFFDGRKPGQRPYCLLDFFPKDFLLILDESHQTIPQINGMYKGDRSRKQTLVDYGFRLPSALDNRPQTFEEFKQFMNHVICMSATPADYEKEHSSQIVEQIIRPTGLVDPEVEVRRTQGQMNDLIAKINETTTKGYRVLVTTITKKLAEDLTDYFADKELKVRYLHSEIDSLERTEIIRQLRLGEFDVLVGINLLREGLDIPEVGLVAILDADKEGFLRNDKSLIQTIGRAARNAESKVILYADRMTDAIEQTVRETRRRRNIQLAYNKKHGITPQTIIKPVPQQVSSLHNEKVLPKKEIPNLIIQLDADMKEAAEQLDFERAIQLRNKMNALKAKLK